HYLEDLIVQVQDQSGHGRLISPELAAFNLLGIINWLYQWYHPEGHISQEELTRACVDFFFRGLLGEGGAPSAARPEDHNPFI
ncbi:MAG TPA: hypothetical protein VGW37_06705, partial [Terriglobia bacterium]|nr:hypothetical protein [Terriglobia bacterium]